MYHFRYPDSETETETGTESLVGLKKERKLRQEAEAQSIRLAGLLHRAVTPTDTSTPRQSDTKPPSPPPPQQQQMDELSSRANQIEEKLERMKVRKDSSQLSSRLASINQQLFELESRPSSSGNQAGELQEQLELIEEATNRIAAKNRHAPPRRWSSQMSLDSAMSSRHNSSFTPDQSHDRVSTLEIELDSTRQVKDELKNRLEQMLVYARSLESELKNHSSELNLVRNGREQSFRELSSERHKVSELATILGQEKDTSLHFQELSKKLQIKFKRCQTELRNFEFENEQLLQQNSNLRAEFKHEIFSKNTVEDLRRENMQLKYELEDERSKLRSVREIQEKMGARYRCEMEEISNTKERLVHEKNNFEKQNFEFTQKTREIEILRETVNTQHQQIEQMKEDQSSILRATGSEVDLLMDTYGIRHQIPEFSSGTLRGLENEPRKWIADLLGKLKWLQSEIKRAQFKDSI